MAKRKRHQRKSEPQQPPEGESHYSPATLFRVELLDQQMRALLQQTVERMLPLLDPDEKAALSRIEAAATPEALIELAGQADGLLKFAWTRRAERFGLELLPLIAARLKGLKDASGEVKQEINSRTLIAELRWRGRAGVDLLLELFNELDEEDQDLAWVVVGLVGLPEDQRQSSIDRIWAYLEQLEGLSRKRWHVGARWALIDLKEPAAAELLYMDLLEGAEYPELWGFLSLAGDGRSAVLLVENAAELPQEQRDEPLFALTSIAHRIGRADFIFALAGGERDEGVLAEIEGMADAVLSIPASTAKDYFSLFYRGFSTEEIKSVYGRLGI